MQRRQLFDDVRLDVMGVVDHPRPTISGHGDEREERRDDEQAGVVRWEYARPRSREPLCGARRCTPQGGGNSRRRRRWVDGEHHHLSVDLGCDASVKLGDADDGCPMKDADRFFDGMGSARAGAYRREPGAFLLLGLLMPDWCLALFE